MVGKLVAGRTYVHVSLLPLLHEKERSRVNDALALADLAAGEHFQVIRLDPKNEEVAFLCYPDFFNEPFPPLVASWRVHLPTGSVQFRDYGASLNPPILHRKELMIAQDHPERVRMCELTRAAESIGLFDDPIRIGFRQQWRDLIASKAFTLVGHELVPLGNDASGDEQASPLGDKDIAINRHLTALQRRTISAPVQALLRHGLLTTEKSFLDYGCGRGHDVEAISSLGISAVGWDPYYRPGGAIVVSDVVNLGFVINVIEVIDERIEALRRAYSLTSGVLAVSAMLRADRVAGAGVFRDGWISSRQTFQKYFSQAELQNFIEGVLDEQATAVGPGI